jgi:hypothetical protein
MKKIKNILEENEIQQKKLLTFIENEKLKKVILRIKYKFKKILF